jgi:hypothetical protein
MNPKRREKLLLLAAALCIGGYLCDRFVLTPLMETWSERAERIASLEQSLANGEQMLKREDVFKTQWAQMLRRSLPTDTAVAEAKVQRAVQEWVLESRLQVTTQKLRWMEDEKEYKLLRYEAAADGDMESIARFLYEMETDSSVAVRFEDAAVVARDQGGQQLSMSVEFTGLALKEE